MELVGTETGDVPKRYSMDMTKDFVPMSVFSETSQGNKHVSSQDILALFLAWIMYFNKLDYHFVL